MRFRLSTLIAVVTSIAVFCGLVFGLPIVVGACVLAFTHWISPSVWISGLVYTRGRTQAFFLGGIVAGAIPAVFSSYYFVMLSPGFLQEWWDGSIPSSEEMTYRLTIGACWLSSGVFAFSGGGLAYAVHRWLAVPKSLPVAPVENALDFRVLEGRFSTSSVNESAVSNRG